MGVLICCLLLCLIQLSFGVKFQASVLQNKDCHPESSVGTSEPLFPYYQNLSAPEDQIDVAGVMGGRLGALWTSLANDCCNNKNICGNDLCARSCPANCWLTGWNSAPTVMIQSFDMADINPASYVPSLIVAQNYTNYYKTQTTSATFSYNEQMTDTYTVTNEQTLSVSNQFTVKGKLKVFDVENAVTFSYSSGQTTSTTKTTAKQWAITWGPSPVPPCTGLYVKCYILAANYYPDFTATYVVDGTPTCQCDGKWYWNPLPITQQWTACNCVGCQGGTYCHNGGCSSVNNVIQVKGKFEGIVGALVQCDNVPYNLDANSCYV